MLVLGLTVGGVSTTQAQINYPYGYRNYGWGGWGGGYGSRAAGMGWMAAGAGSYNMQTAEARNINLQTRLQYNEYMYESLVQNQNKLVHEHEKEYQDYRDAADAAQDRLRNHPTQADIVSGEALNVALVELIDPRYAGEVAQAANVPMDGRLIENLRFRNTTEVVSTTLDKLTNAQPHGLLAEPRFAADVQAYRDVCKQINSEIVQSKQVKPATVGKFRDVLKAALAKVEPLTDVDINQKIKAVNSLKAMLAMCYMFNDVQALDVYLAGVGERKDVKVGDLLGFMQSFNLTFDAAKNPAQNSTYAQVYQILAGLRGEIFGTGHGTLPLDPPRTNTQPSDVANFYAGVHTNELNPSVPRTNPPAPPPPPPAP
jgi:hypothetical protein